MTVNSGGAEQVLIEQLSERIEELEKTLRIIYTNTKDRQIASLCVAFLPQPQEDET